MTGHVSIALCLMLLSSQTRSAGAEPLHRCPINCQCFSANRVLCSDQRMSSLPENLSGEIREVIVMTTSVAYLSPNTFQGSPQLTKLVFLKNAIREVHAKAFRNLTRLEELDLSGNPWLEHLVQGTFSQQGNLTKLQLNFNRLKTVLPDTFHPLGNLETLEMKGNLVADLPASLFRSLQRLHHLDLSQNWLEEVTRENLEALTELRTLKLNYNLISRLFADTFHNVSRLKELHLEGNQLSDLPGDVFSALTRLEVLNLRGNFLSNFSSDVFPSSLRELTLKGNELIELSGSSFRGLSSLAFLTLSTNLLSQLPPDLFLNLKALEDLDLSENHLTSLPGEIFSGLGGVRVIRLQKNNLTEMAAELFEDQPLLRQLHLQDNRLQSVAPGLFAPFQFQNVVRLHGNPWRCDCQASYLHDWMLNHSADAESQDKVRCGGPGPLRGRPLASVDKERLVCRLPPEDRMMAADQALNCTLHTADGAVVVKCKVDTCSPLKVRVQFEAEDGSVYENVVQRQWPGDKQCDNNTISNRTETPS
ncbi:Carboxypeptidase N subunit 2 [Merluccius polli]|uniref:Carboxypeptidase N subunit 2 n=1 Tax=Merluccius polli TaxID=89951 RepID=A0AA47NAQ2_MERPO|nr:Carboxypeptidase N subunit 2 [Merluccius polli]